MTEMAEMTTGLNWRAHRPAGGFTLVEIMIVVAIIACILTIALANQRASLEEAHRLDCDIYRKRVEEAEVNHLTWHGTHSETLADLIEAGILTRERRCRSGGVHDWIPYSEDHPSYQTQYGCSIHDWPDKAGGSEASADGSEPSAIDGKDDDQGNQGNGNNSQGNGNNSQGNGNNGQGNGNNGQDNGNNGQGNGNNGQGNGNNGQGNGNNGQGNSNNSRGHQGNDNNGQGKKSR